MNFHEGYPIYLQIAERLMDEILAGLYKSDERVPGVRDYSALLQVNVNTTVKAFDVLVQKGILYNKRGLGSFVSEDARHIISNSRQDDLLNKLLPDLAHQMQHLDIPLEKVIGRLQQLLNTTQESVSYTHLTLHFLRFFIPQIASRQHHYFNFLNLARRKHHHPWQFGTFWWGKGGRWYHTEICGRRHTQHHSNNK